MLKNETFHIKNNLENEKISKIKSKRKSKSINKENIRREKVKEQILSLNYLSNKNQKNNNNFDIFKEINKNKFYKKNFNLLFNKRKSKIEIDANKPFLKKNSGNNFKSNKEENKENYLTENPTNNNKISKESKRMKINNIEKNNYLKKKLKNIKDKVNYEENLKNQNEEIKGKIRSEIIEDKLNNIIIKGMKEIKEDNKEMLINKKEKNKNKEDIVINKSTQNKEQHIQIQDNIIISQMEQKKENQNSNSKNDTPLLQLNDVNLSSSSSKIKNKKSVTSEDITNSSYDSNNNFEIKGEFLSKNEKTNFLNNLKKCLFNKEINIENEYLKSNKLKKINLKKNLSITESHILEDNININSAFITKAGIDDKKEKINQDSYLILEKLFENNLNIFGVFDGHGKNGHLISSLVSKFLTVYLSKKENYYMKDNNDSDSDSDSSFSSKEININQELLSDLFSKEDFIKKLINELDLKANECNFDLQFSGTTCLLLFILNDTLICSNIGDSICVLFNCSDEDRWTTEMISKIHKPDIPSEKERILLNGGIIHPYYDEYGIYEGPNRVYAKGKTYPGLSLTRSIGDLEGEKIGIISEPDIIIKKIDSNCKYIIMGSDGLWDVIKPYDVRRIVNPYFIKNDPKGACQALLKTASKNWERDKCDRDDITIIVIFIGVPN